MAIVDADYRFTFIDVGSPGADGDFNTFSRTSIGRKILQNDPSLNLPENSIIDNVECPYFFVADDAFPLNIRIMKPYSGRFSKTGIEEDKIIFNYRLSRARRTVENAFGILVMRWGCLRNELQCRPEKVQIITAACCALHNYMMKETAGYITTSTLDRYCEDGSRIDGEWRMVQQLTSINHNSLSGRGRSKDDATALRDHLKKYVNNIYTLPFQEAQAFR